MLKNSIDGFSTNFNKLEDYKDAADAVESINARLAFSLEEMKKYNTREMMCGLGTTNYDEIAQMKK